jgi:hypothetical protein
VADKIGDDDKETIEKALEEVNERLDDNQDAEKEEFDEKLKEVQGTCSPIVSKVYQESGGAPGGGGDFGGDDDLHGHDELCRVARRRAAAAAMAPAVAMETSTMAASTSCERVDSSIRGVNRR